MSKGEDDPLIGTQLGPYRILARQGNGAMGVVYKAEHVLLRRLSALKILRAATVEDDPVAVARFEREARSAASLRHANIVLVHNVGEAAGRHFIDMEFVDGEDLQARLARERRLSVEDATQIVLRTAQALAAAHRENIVHRDIKPRNIMLGRDGAVKVTDFGLAKDVASSTQLTVTGQIQGTPSYMSPEQCEGGDLDHRTDVYSLGVTHFYLVTGQLPFKGNSHLSVMLKHKTEPMPDPCSLVPSLPTAVREILQKSMAKEPDDRYQSADELVDDLRSVLTALADATTQSLPQAAPGTTVIVPDALSDLPAGDAEDTQLIVVPAGTFRMGSEDGRGDEKPVHEVHVPAFHIGKHQITNQQWKLFVDANPNWSEDRIEGEHHDGNYLKHWEGDSYSAEEASHPVTWVSWYAAKAYCEWAGGRLPTEAEWEYACRAGSTDKYCFGDDANKLGEYAWFWSNSDETTHPVGQKISNAGGVLDMHGNVWEWCSSKYRRYPYRADDGREDLEGSRSVRVLRGGSWYDIAHYCRSAYRSHSRPTYTHGFLGFRLCVSGRALR